MRPRAQVKRRAEAGYRAGEEKGGGGLEGR